MKHSRLVCFLITSLASRLLTYAQVVSPLSGPPLQPGTIMPSSICGTKGTYDELTGSQRKPRQTPNIPLGNSPVELTISAAQFGDKPVDATRAASPNFCEWSTIQVGVNVSATGEFGGFMNGGGSFRGGGGGKLAPEDFARLESLMSRLPDDHRRVPPATRRIMVEVNKNGAAMVRLYDSANLPDEILEMLRLTRAPIKVVTLAINPDRALTSEEAASLKLPMSDGTRAISPDGSIGVLHDFSRKTLTVYRGATWGQFGLPTGGEIVSVIQEFWQPPQYGGYAVGVEFSPDGRYLLVKWGNNVGTLLFDARTWQPVTDPKLFPQNLKEYLPSADWRLGIALTDAGETLIWDQRSHRVLSKLPGLGEFEDPPVIRNQQGQRVYDIPTGEIRAAAFSPDQTRVAIYSGPDDVSKLGLNIWNVRAGKKERDLTPVAAGSYANGQPVWWNDGHWLVSPLSGNEAGIWDAETGRFKGRLNLAGCNVHFRLTTEGARLLQFCSMGKGPKDKVLAWSVDEVRKQMESFEAKVVRGDDSLQ